MDATATPIQDQDPVTATDKEDEASNDEGCGYPSEDESKPNGNRAEATLDAMAAATEPIDVDSASSQSPSHTEEEYDYPLSPTELIKRLDIEDLPNPAKHRAVTTYKRPAAKMETPTSSPMKKPATSIDEE
eukprot:10049430-Lingulodinium_polyedra.AAC.1